MDSMLIFHALARMGFEGLVIVSPQDPLVSIGYFQDADKEIDITNCNRLGIPYIRREVGGGAVYLDKNQIFYHMIWKRGNPLFPEKISGILRFLSEAPIRTYEHFGIDTHFHGENDIVTSAGRKIAGEAGGDIGDSMVFVGSIIMDFDFDIMPKLLKVPDEKFRDKIHKSLDENLTTMRRELDEVPPREEIVDVLVESFERLVTPLHKIDYDSAIDAKIREIAPRFASKEFLFKRSTRNARGVKIAHGVELLYGIHKAPGGLIRNVQTVEAESIQDITFSGDFQMFPKAALAEIDRNLSNTPRHKNEITDKLADIFNKTGIESPGVSPEDLTQSILSANRSD